MATSWEVANKCPVCGLPGAEASTQHLGYDGKLLTMACQSSLCATMNNGVSVLWMIQIRADGTIPDPQDHSGAPKEYSKDFDIQYKQAQELAQRILNESLGKGPQG